MDWIVALGIFGTTVIFGAGGLAVTLRHLKCRHEEDMNALKETVQQVREEYRKASDTHESRLNRHEEHFARHDVVFENISVNLEYLVKGMDEMKGDIADIKQTKP